MAYDEHLAARIRAVIPPGTLAVERKMFGGLAFLVGGHMGCGVLSDRLMIRVAPDAYDRMLAEPYVKPMDFSGRPMRGFVYVEPAGIADEAALDRWVQRGLTFASSLAPK
jgi:TfoX/Sxy family transcriptional regulator of competence genes